LLRVGVPVRAMIPTSSRCVEVMKLQKAGGSSCPARRSPVSKAAKCGGRCREDSGAGDYLRQVGPSFLAGHGISMSLTRVMVVRCAM
jgi:hypothetical protein